MRDPIDWRFLIATSAICAGMSAMAIASETQWAELEATNAIGAPAKADIVAPVLPVLTAKEPSGSGTSDVSKAERLEATGAAQENPRRSTE